VFLKPIGVLALHIQGVEVSKWWSHCILGQDIRPEVNDTYNVLRCCVITFICDATSWLLMWSYILFTFTCVMLCKGCYVTLRHRQTTNMLGTLYLGQDFLPGTINTSSDCYVITFICGATSRLLCNATSISLSFVMLRQGCYVTLRHWQTTNMGGRGQHSPSETACFLINILPFSP